MRSRLIHGSKTWPMKKDQEVKLDRTEVSMPRLPFGFKTKEMPRGAKIKELFGMEPVSLVIKKDRLSWF